MAETGLARSSADGSRKAFVEKRKGRYMAQTLEVFEEIIEPLVTAEVAAEFKALVRRKMNALATDVIELLELEDKAKNGVAQDIVDGLFPDGMPARGKG
jgi:hypothetical protein